MKRATAFRQIYIEKQQNTKDPIRSVITIWEFFKIERKIVRRSIQADIHRKATKS
jgi:hypothetical protein